MINIAKCLICLLLVALFSFILCKINARKTHRVRQLFLPLVMGILGAAGAFAVYRKISFAQLITNLSDFFSGTEIAVANIALLLALTVCKAILSPINAAVVKDKKLLEFCSTGFYEYSEDYSEWFLKKKWTNFRSFMRAVTVGMTIACGIFLGITWITKGDFRIFAFPAAALAVICEIYNYVNGSTKEEFEYSFFGMEADSRRISSYFKLREIYEKLLPEPLLTAHTGMEYMGRKSSIDLLKKLKSSEDTIDILTSHYFLVDDRYKTADPDCVTSTAKMMHGQSVIFFNPFYRDMSVYITLPIINTMLQGKKVLIITGRHSNSNDVKEWISEVIGNYSHMRSLWRVCELNTDSPECEIGIMSFPMLYNNIILAANKDFLGDTGFVLLIEPSVILNTGQVALSIIAREIQHNNTPPVFCVLDRQVDGLIDTLSHLLRTELTEVTAAPLPRCIYSGVSWDADGDFKRNLLFDKQSRYLGNGVELAAIAVKNQIPKVTWFSETKAPVRDIKWLAGQYYPSICKYMNQPVQQEVLYDKIKFVSNLWCTPNESESFIIAEDEFCNVFGAMRTYLSRGTKQSFINILSQNYLLRDYMRCNKQMFISNPNVIPSIVPDYAKTERNTIIKLLLSMTYRAVSDAEVLEEFSLVGIETNDSLDILTRMLEKYTFADQSVLNVHTVRTQSDEKTTISTLEYTISNDLFATYFSDTLRNAYFVIEDEQTDSEYIDAKLFSHITQKILPGQFITYDGKYYLVKHISPQSGVVLRRASDLYDGRKYYRQLRRYHLTFPEDDCISSRRTVMDIEIAYLSADIEVKTEGYLEMSDDHNLRTAKLIDYHDDPVSESFTRRYHNKTVLRVKYPESDDKLRFTLCMLFSEIFKSIFPDGWQYLAVVSDRPDDIEGYLNYMVYPLEGECGSDYIYFIEDSDIDLGLLEAIERNLNRFTEIVADFLEWHTEKMHEPLSSDPAPVSVQIQIEQKKKKRNLFSRMADRIRRLFGGKTEETVTFTQTPTNSPEPENAAKPADGQPTDSADSPSDPSVIQTAENPQTDSSTGDQVETAAPAEGGDYSLDSAEEAQPALPELSDDSDTAADYSLDAATESTQSEPQSEDAPDHSKPWSPDDGTETDGDSDPDIVDIDGTDIFDTAGLSESDQYLEDQFRILGLTEISKTRYQLDCFLKFGFDEIDSRLHIDELYKYLRVRGWCNNYLTKARQFDLYLNSKPDLDAVNHCDFCGMPLTGVSYEQLNDGRIRCNDCSASAISTIEEYRELFYQIIEMMEAFFNIKYKIPIKAVMLDAREVAKRSGVLFTPSTGVAPRSLGFAQKKHGEYSIVIENGSPRLAAIDTIVHEMTHIWQFMNWNDNQVSDIFKMNNPTCTAKASDIVYEGMAMWASIQYLYLMGETYYATVQEELADSRTDIYGIGFRLYKEQYPLIKDASLLKYSPFYSFPPLEPAKVTAAVRRDCTDPKCTC